MNNRSKCICAWALFSAFAVGFALIERLNSPKCNEAYCTFVCTERNVETNVFGEIIQPVEKLGISQDEGRVLREKFRAYLAGNFAGDPTKVVPGLIERFVCACPVWSNRQSVVSNAFESIEFEIAGRPIALVTVSAKSPQETLPLDIVNFLANGFRECIRGSETYVQGKALAWLEHECRRKEKIGECVSEEKRKMAVLRECFGKPRRKVVVLQSNVRNVREGWGCD